ncbi:MAG: hypothetical protein ACN6OI_05295 [Flavobacterium sp.]
MNLEELNLVELNVQEELEVEGGFLVTLPIFAFAWGYLYEKHVA